MAIHRIQTEADFKNYGKARQQHVTIPDEWDENNGQTRVDDPTWIERYRYEAEIINGICERNGYKKVIELGSGPGTLGQCVLELNPEIEYTYVDKHAAREVFKAKNYVGNFHVKDLMDSFDLSDLDNDYDLVVANDFLEHIANPSDVMFKCRQITKDKGGFFISVPNWRMGHDFIYRGLFDYDNFIYFCQVHGWSPEEVAGSPLKCQALPKLSSEDTMPTELLDSWNWYFYTQKQD